jgi:RNA polymerase subunit RPABC4/transcription elongation factor Spt4
MYAIISCGKCKRRRIIDRSSPSSVCPFCGRTEEHKGLRVIFENRDQNAVREMLMKTQSIEKPKKKIPGADPDPLSTLIYKYENCRDVQSRTELLSKGLTGIYGTFTLEDVERVDEKNAEKLLNTMLELCLVHEVRPGRYCA